MSHRDDPIDARTLPHNLEAERAVLGAILVQNEAVYEALDRVRPEDFYRDAHRRIFRHMTQLSATRTGIDLVTLTESLSRDGELESVDGPAYLTALVDGRPRSTNIAHYADIVREKARLRQVIVAANRMLAKAYDADEDARTVLAEAEQALFAIAMGERRGGLVHIGGSVQRTVAAIEEWAKARHGITGIATGFRDIDDMTSGLQRGHLIILAARPSMGKSALAGNIALHVAQHIGPVGVFSLEMDEIELVIRHLASSARVDGRRLQRGRLFEAEWGRVANEMGAIAASQLFVDDAASVSLVDIRGRARRLKAEHGLALLVVDYLQLMEVQKTENRNVDIGLVSRGLKALAKELDVPVLVLSQLNRGPELRQDHRPMLSDLRESGSLEQDANLVLFLYRDEWYHDVTDANRGIAELIFAKHRGGPLGTVKLRWVAEETRFEDDDQGRQPQDVKQLQLSQGDR